MELLLRPVRYRRKSLLPITGCGRSNFHSLIGGALSFAYLTLYTGDYLRDTRHLSCAEHGIYLLLLMHCWDSKGPVPLDERKIIGICNARSGDEVEAVRRVLTEFFVRMDDGWYNERMAEEVAKAEHISKKNREAGLKSVEIRRKIRSQRALNDRSTVAGNLTPTPTITPTPNTKEKSIVEQARRILAFLNEKTGRNYRPVKANLDMLTARLAEGATETELRQVVAKKCREWAGDEKMNIYLRPKTLFSRTNFANYQGELGGNNAMS